MVAVYHVLNGDSLLARPDGNGHSMLVRPSYEQHLTTLETKIADIDVGRNVYAGKMSYVYRPVCVWQGGGHGCPFEFLIHVSSHFGAKLQRFRLKDKGF